MDKETVHRYTAAYPAGTPLYNTEGNLYSNTPTHLAPFRARTVRTMHNTRLIPASLLAAPQFPLPSGLPPRTRRNMSWASTPFHMVFALQRTDMVPHSGFTYSKPCHSTAFLKAFLVQGTWVKINSVFFRTWALKFHRLRSEVVPPIADTHRRCR